MCAAKTFVLEQVKQKTKSTESCKYKMSLLKANPLTMVVNLFFFFLH